ncbi:putative Ctr copper transporter [Tuber indicum]|nr:putative Ctr copper transporter [Tuber indicum]
MADFTRHSDQDGSSGTDPSTISSTGGDHSSSHSMPSGMSMAFHTGMTDSLYSSAWTPNSPEQYAGTIAFLVLLAFTYRFLVAWRSVLDRKRAVKDNERSVLVAAGKAGSLGSSEGLDGGRRTGSWGGRPWRWSVDLPRAWMQVVTSGVGYLLMLAVMTFNVGYFLAVLTGVFFGELIFGRWIHGSEH